MGKEEEKGGSGAKEGDALAGLVRLIYALLFRFMCL